jgi:hypothetical protein
VSTLLAEEVWDAPLPTIDSIQNTLLVACEIYPELTGYDPLLTWDLPGTRAALRAAYA